MSVYSDILTAVRNTVDTLLPGVDQPNFYIRKRPELRKGHDSTPCVFVCPRTESISDQTFVNTAIIDYPVVVVIVQETNLNLESTLIEQMDWRELIREALWKTTLTGVSEVYDCDYDPEPIFDTSGLQAAFDVSLQQFTFRARQDRSDGT